MPPCWAMSDLGHEHGDSQQPAGRAAAIADLSSQGINAKAFAKVVGLIANDKIYVLTLVAQESNRAAKEPVFDQIIGSFGPN